MTDEEVLKIAQGLTPREWRALALVSQGIRLVEVLDNPLRDKGLTVGHRWTTLGKAVWEWRELFWIRGPRD